LEGHLPFVNNTEVVIGIRIISEIDECAIGMAVVDTGIDGHS
jgi:hypothetical protein